MFASQNTDNVSIRSHGDRVVIVLSGQRTDWVFSCVMAEQVAEALETAAAAAEKEPPSIIRGDKWGCLIKSYDGKVCIRFKPPFPGAPSRVPMRASVARKVADKIRTEASFAQYHLRLEVNGDDI